MLLGRVENAGSVATITLDLPQGLQVFEIIGRVAGYSAGDIARLQFNRDTGNNYAFRTNVSTSVTDVTGAAVAGITVATVTITGPRGLIWARVEKRTAALPARVIGHTHSDQEGSATAPLSYGFRGTWNNTAALINAVSLNGGAGGASLLAGSYLEVWGARDTH